MKGRKTTPRKRKGEKQVGDSSRKKPETGSLLDPSQLLQKIEKLIAKGLTGIWISRWNKKTFGDYSHLRLGNDPRGFPIRIVSDSYEDTQDSYSHEVDIHYLKLLQKMVTSEQIKISNSFTDNYNHAKDLASESPLNLLSEDDVYRCVEDYISIYGIEESAKQWKRMRDELLHADATTRDKISNDNENFVNEIRRKFPWITVVETQLSVIGEAWKSSGKNWEEIVKTFLDGTVSFMEKCSTCRLEYVGYTKADYLKLKLEVAGKLGIIKEKVDPNFPPGHPKLSDID